MTRKLIKHLRTAIYSREVTDANNRSYRDSVGRWRVVCDHMLAGYCREQGETKGEK